MTYPNLYFVGGTRLISAKDPVDSVLAVIRGRLRKQDAIASSQGKNLLSCSYHPTTNSETTNSEISQIFNRIVFDKILIHKTKHYKQD